jgi:hypothetical protein
MKTKIPLIGGSICAVVLLILGSLTNVVGFQTIQSSNQQIIKDEINQKELLFQTIVDIANNKEIQRIILMSQMSRGIFPTSEFPVVTKNQLKMMYFLGLILSKFLSKSRIHSMVGKYQFDNQGMQKEISTVIKKDTTLNAELAQLLNSKCDCENENTTGLWHFPIFCSILGLIIVFIEVSYIYTISDFVGHLCEEIIYIVLMIGYSIDCFWVYH